MKPELERQMIPCLGCLGTGYVGIDYRGRPLAQLEKCDDCDGSGQVLESHEAYEERLVKIIWELAEQLTLQQDVCKSQNEWLADAEEAVRRRLKMETGIIEAINHLTHTISLGFLCVSIALFAILISIETRK